MNKTKPILNFAHLCDNAFLSNDGKLNVIGIFKFIKTQKIPFMHPKIGCVLNFTVESPEHLIKIQILKKESHEVIAKLEGRLNNPIQHPITDQPGRTEVGFISDFNNIKFEEVGSYKIEIWLDNELFHTLPFHIELLSK